MTQLGKRECGARVSASGCGRGRPASRRGGQAQGGRPDFLFQQLARRPRLLPNGSREGTQAPPSCATSPLLPRCALRSRPPPPRSPVGAARQDGEGRERRGWARGDRRTPGLRGAEKCGEPLGKRVGGGRRGEDRHVAARGRKPGGTRQRRETVTKSSRVSGVGRARSPKMRFLEREDALSPGLRTPGAAR